MGLVASRSVRIRSCFRGSVVGLVALSLLAGCSHTQEAGSAERPKPAAQATARDDDAAETEAKPVEQDGPTLAEPSKPQPAAPPVAAARPAEKSKRADGGPPSAAAPKAGMVGLSGQGFGAGGQGIASTGSSGRLGGAQAKRMAPMRTPAGVLAPAPSTAPIERDAEMNTENYAHVTENPFLAVQSQPLSTFSVDVDTASYSNSRRFLAE